MPIKLQPWLIWLAATSFVFFQFLLQTSTSVMVPSLMQDFQIDPLQVGILSSSYFYSYLTLQLPAGMLVDRFGARAVLSIGIVIFTVACWLFAQASNVYLAQLARILMGVGSAPIIGTTFALVANWFPAKRFALMIGITDTIGMMGGIAGQAYLARWVEAVGWRATLSGCTFVSLIISVLVIALVRDQKIAHTTTAPMIAPKAFKQLKQIISSRQIWLNGIFIAMIWGVAIAFTGLWSVPFLQAQFHLSLSSAATASSMVFVGVAVASPIIGWLADTYNQQGRALMVGCTCIGLLTLSCVLYASYLPLTCVYILLFLFGGSTGSYIIAFSIVRKITAPSARATAMSFTNMMSLLVGSPLLQPLIGYCLAKQQTPLAQAANFSAHSFKLAFLVLPLCLAIALVTTFFIKIAPAENA